MLRWQRLAAGCGQLPGFMLDAAGSTWKLPDRPLWLLCAWRSLSSYGATQLAWLDSQLAEGKPTVVIVSCRRGHCCCCCLPPVILSRCCASAPAC